MPLSVLLMFSPFFNILKKAITGKHNCNKMNNITDCDDASCTSVTEKETTEEELEEEDDESEEEEEEEETEPEELFCCVCQDVFTDPRTINPCGHTVCFQCSKNITKCPLCREDVLGFVICRAFRDVAIKLYPKKREQLENISENEYDKNQKNEPRHAAYMKNLYLSQLKLQVEAKINTILTSIEKCVKLKSSPPYSIACDQDSTDMRNLVMSKLTELGYKVSIQNTTYFFCYSITF